MKCSDGILLTYELHLLKEIQNNLMVINVLHVWDQFVVAIILHHCVSRCGSNGVLPHKPVDWFNQSGQERCVWSQFGRSQIKAQMH